MTPILHDTLLTQLKWRYATKKFDPAKKIAIAVWSALEEALVLTPTSYGLQPLKFLVLTDPALRAQLVPISWGQTQPVDCSHFVIFAARAQNTEADVDRYISRMAEVRGVTSEALAGFKNVLVGDVVNGPRGKVALEWAARQAYIALGNFMTAAALVGVDTCPMEGFDPAKYDEVLGLPAQGFHAVVACAAGYRAVDDKYAGMPKVRFAASELIDRR
ncbi:MAG: NAD(P)H-dependent oxidoreductase [Chthoniobacter sp.]|nr:NAD(P)H-dependent oxidoreductase [Chthoniobacter sp.]